MTKRRDAYSFFILDARERSRTFYWCVGVSVIAALFSITAGDNDITLALIVGISTTICFGIRLALYTKTQSPEHSRSVKSVAQPFYYRRHAFTLLTAVTFLEVANRVRAATVKKAIQTAIYVNSTSASLIKAIVTTKVSSQNPESLLSLAHRTAAVFRGQRIVPTQIVDSYISANAARIARRALASSQAGILSTNFDLNGSAAGGILVRDTFLYANGTIFSSRPEPTAYGIRIEGQPDVAVFNAAIQGLTQSLDGIIWVNVRFDQCHINIGDGPFELSQCVFNGCAFKTLGPSNTELPSALQSSNGRPVSYSSALTAIGRD